MHPAQIVLFAISAVCILAASAPWWEDALASWRDKRAIQNRKGKDDV